MQKRIYYIIALAALLIPTSAKANAGVPMIFISMPIMLIGLLPVIRIEAYVIKNKLNLPPKNAIISSAVANAVSTIIGVPLTWSVLVFLQVATGGGEVHGLHTFFQKFLAVTWQAPWLIPYESDLGWMIPTAMLVLLAPFFFVSWKVEYFIIKRIHRRQEKNSINAACLKANLITYGLFALVPIGLYLM